MFVMSNEDRVILDEAVLYARKPFDIFPSTGCTNTMWLTNRMNRKGDTRKQLVPLKSLPIPYLRNIYQMFWDKAGAIVTEQRYINLYTEAAYRDRYAPVHVHRRMAFLYEFVPCWNTLRILLVDNNDLSSEGYPRWVKEPEQQKIAFDIESFSPAGRYTEQDNYLFNMFLGRSIPIHVNYPDTKQDALTPTEIGMLRELLRDKGIKGK